MENNNERTELEKQVDKELIAKGAEVAKDFDESKALVVPATSKAETLKAMPDGILNHMSAVVEKEANDPHARNKILLDQIKHKRKQMKDNAPKIINRDGFFLYDDAQTTMWYDLIKLNDPRVNAILTAAQFKLTDLNGKVVYPKPKE
jgi:hypothetical protein